MQFLHQAQIISFHRKRYSGDLGDHHALGWRHPDSQLKRFASLVKGFDLNHASILDVGCGVADFKTYIDKKFEGVSYTGIDIVPEFVNEAARRFANNNFAAFIYGDFSTTPLTEVDYVMSCGALSYRNTDPEYQFKMIRKMWHTARKGIAFTMLNKAVFPKHNLLIGFNIEELLEYAQLFTANVSIEQDYLPDDFTIKMQHEQ